MSEQEQHPAARHADQLAWAVWIAEGDKRGEVYAVTGDTEAEARENALERAENGEVRHVDGPIQDGDPGIWEFEYVTERRERVVVEAPSADYAEETAESQRTHRGEYIRDVHTESRRVADVSEVSADE